MTTLGIFAKPPIPGRVKTRLIADIGANHATEVYRFCLKHTLQVAHQSGLNYLLFLSEESRDPIFAQAPYQLQQGEDLGTKMCNALNQMLAQDQHGAIIIGSDCLDLSAEQLQASATALCEADLVFLPALDGGFGLIGCRKIEPQIFRDVEWSTDTVLSKTLANAKRLNYRTQLLESVRDIDTLADLKHYPDLINLIETDSRK